MFRTPVVPGMPGNAGPNGSKIVQACKAFRDGVEACAGCLSPHAWMVMGGWVSGTLSIATVVGIGVTISKDDEVACPLECVQALTPARALEEIVQDAPLGSDVPTYHPCSVERRVLWMCLVAIVFGGSMISLLLYQLSQESYPISWHAPSTGVLLTPLWLISFFTMGVMMGLDLRFGALLPIGLPIGVFCPLLCRRWFALSPPAATSTPTTPGTGGAGGAWSAPPVVDSADSVTALGAGTGAVSTSPVVADSGDVSRPPPIWFCSTESGPY